MKTLKIFLTTLFAIVFGITISAQTHDHMNMNIPTTKAETFKVWVIGGFAPTPYYSSTESINNHAWHECFSNGY